MPSASRGAALAVRLAAALSALSLLVCLAACLTAAGCGEAADPGERVSASGDPGRLATREECQQACDHGASLCGPTSYDCVQFCLDEQAPLSGIECALAASTCEAARTCYGGQLPE